MERFYQTGSIRGIQAVHAAKLGRVLGLLDIAAGPEDLNVPSFKLHPFKDKRKGHWSIGVNGNWRVTFQFAGTDVKLVDTTERSIAMAKNPPHSGELLREDVLAPLGLLVKETAKRCMSRVTLSRVLNGHAAFGRAPRTGGR